MGGYGSGEWRSSRYATIEQCCALSAAWLRSRGAIRAGCMVTSTASWVRQPGNEDAGSIEADARPVPQGRTMMSGKSGAAASARSARSSGSLRSAFRGCRRVPSGLKPPPQYRSA